MPVRLSSPTGAALRAAMRSLPTREGAPPLTHPSPARFMKERERTRTRPSPLTPSPGSFPKPLPRTCDTRASPLEARPLRGRCPCADGPPPCPKTQKKTGGPHRGRRSCDIRMIRADDVRSCGLPSGGCRTGSAAAACRASGPARRCRLRPSCGPASPAARRPGPAAARPDGRG